MVGNKPGGAGGGADPSRFAPQVYEDLRRQAAARLNGSGPRLNLQPSAIVHEAYLRMVDQSQVDWQGRTIRYSSYRSPSNTP